ncbi:filamentous hemagglutinin N-terminal domain-containing protein [Trinickia sp. NRRL B-1857]|uniref:two-partner secretion domain-containing protein n=1 Tax=Trinickia sp. NRRL B-1857 TaxID=3162879 RepID=UPI003D2B9E6B
MEHSRRFQHPTQPALTPLFIALSFAIPGVALAAGPLPQGGHFVAGTGSMTGNSTSLTINQTSARGIVDWNSFSIGNGNSVSINNGPGATLNRVTGANPSSILGALSATGSVYLINPQGIVVGQSGVVSTGGRFVASTLDVDNTAFMNGGALTFSSPLGIYDGTVVNLGKIASSGGDVLLISGSEVDNVGTISAAHGTAEIAAGQRVLLQDSSTGQQVFVQNGSAGKIVNRGTVEAAQISLQAADGNIFALAGNHSILRATGTTMRDGHVWLVADTGRVWLDGTVEARNATGSGGTVDTNAATLRIAGGPIVKAKQWNITTPNFTIDGLAAPVFQSNLDRGTSINLQTTGAGGTSGDIDVVSSIHWIGTASLTLGAYHSLTIEAAANLRNCGNGNLTLRADAQAIDNGGSIANKGTVDWSTSHGIVSLFYDMNGTYSPGNLLTNKSWTSPIYSGLVTQITGYLLVNSLADLEHVNANLAGNYALGRDIDASSTSDGSYVPIGSGSTAFTGQFDGQSHTIRSLTIDGLPTQTVGMFASLGKTAVVRDLNVNGHATIN